MATLVCGKCRTSYWVERIEPGQAARCPKCHTANVLAAQPPAIDDKAVPPAAGKPQPQRTPAARAATPPDKQPVTILEAPPAGAAQPPTRLDRERESEETVIVDSAKVPLPAAPPPAKPKTRTIGYQPPPKLGPYEVQQQIGHGGMGIILQAHDEALKREVAIKTLHPENRTDNLKRMRFIKEAQITGQLEHPGIVPVHYLGWDEDGSEFFSMKLVSGTTLDKILDLWHAEDPAIRKEYTQARLLSIFERVCETVSFAHSRGVIHRDLKPSNVMIGAHGEVWVLDWGLAKLVGVDDGTDKRAPGQAQAQRLGGDIADVRTLDGTVVGTPEYMAPEQAVGDALDEGVDIFALGGLLYEMLTSRPPHGGKTINEVVSRAATGKFTPVRRTPVGQQAPPALAAIAEKCLAHRRGNRYATVDDLLRDLRAYAAGEAISAKPDRWLDRFKRFTSRHRRAVATSVALTALFLVTIVIASVMIAQKDRTARNEQAQRLQAEINEQKAQLEKQAALAAGAAKGERRLRAFEPYVKATDLLSRGQLAERAAALLTEALNIDPEFPEAQFALAEALRGCGLPRQAAEAYLKADALNQKIGGRPNLPAIVAAGFAYDGAGDYANAEDAFQRAEKLGANDPLALVGRVFRLGHQRRYREGKQVAEQALQLGAHLWEVHFALGYLLSDSVQEGILPPDPTLQAAIDAFRKALELSPRQAEVCAWLAITLTRGEPLPERAREATQLKERAIALEPLNGNRYIARAMGYLFGGAIELAEKDAAEARRLGVSPSMLQVYQARLAVLRNDREEAFRLMGEVLKTTREWPSHVENYLNLGFGLRHFDEVMPLYERWCKNNPQYSGVYYLRGILKEREGDLRGALAEARAGLDVAPYNLRLRAFLVDVLRRNGQFKEALDAADKTLEFMPRDLAARRGRVDALAALKRFDEALEYLTELEKDDPRQKGKRQEIEQLRANDLKK